MNIFRESATLLAQALPADSVLFHHVAHPHRESPLLPAAARLTLAKLFLESLGPPR
jgi:hypothetical protein